MTQTDTTTTDPYAPYVSRLREALAEALFAAGLDDDPSELKAYFDRCAPAWQALLDEQVPTLEAPLAPLKQPERDVLELLVEGYSNKRIASTLSIGLRTVELRRAKILKKFGATSAVHLGRLVERYRTAAGDRDQGPPETSAGEEHGSEPAPAPPAEAAHF